MDMFAVTQAKFCFATDFETAQDRTGCREQPLITEEWRNHVSFGPEKCGGSYTR